MELGLTTYLLAFAIAVICGFAASAFMFWALPRRSLTPPVFKAVIAGEFVVVTAVIFYVAISLAGLSRVAVQ
ncbi:MAG: hypothetical protein QNJ67_03580 [Kiloniellales bacterium]|nr:hypothetical protein [Kiloniellales bacterium]